tara:strand:+ start:328 stop:879 length:552 start_codon:yes stop_codon:yes gene_type:complete
MQIAITGHTAGIGKSFAKQLKERGHMITGISRSEGENIRRIPHIASLIEPCDLFINNAQSGYAQTELLYEVWKRWQGKDKYIWNISTIMTEQPVNSIPHNLDDLEMSQYRLQKLALEEASRQLTWKDKKPYISVIRPGEVDTQGRGGENVDVWTKSVIDIFTLHDSIHLSQVSIAKSKNRIPL